MRIFCVSALVAVWRYAAAHQVLQSDGIGAIRVQKDSTSCLDISWPPSDASTRLIPQTPSDELRQILAEVDAARIRTIIEKLVSFGTRNTLSAQDEPDRGIGAARDWIASEMQIYATASDGRMTVSVPSFIQQPGNGLPVATRISNIVARLEGSSDPSRVYVISGHYDSRASDVLDGTSDAPGANDDASGVAISMELARILATRKLAATVIFTAVASEEQGLQGSAFLAQTLRNSSTNVEAMLNNDIVGSSMGDKGQSDPFTVRLFAEGIPRTESPARQQQRLQIGGENDSPARQLARFVKEVGENNATGMNNVAIIFRLDRFLRGGDHSSFLQQGYAAVRFTEPNEIFAHQHQDVRVEDGVQFGDLTEFVDMEYVARVGRTNLAALWSLANVGHVLKADDSFAEMDWSRLAPGQPRNVTINTAVLENSSRLRWLPGSGDVAGYEVVWRATDAPQWTNSLPVGNVQSVTVPLPKDNVILGVRAVGSNGLKSPAVYPFPG